MSLSSDPNADATLASAAALVPQGKHAGQPAIALVRPATIIGARQRSHVHLLSSSVSKAHAVLIRTQGGFYVRDLAARTGVYLNGRSVREADLAHGDLIKIGNFVFRFDASSDFAAAPRAPRAPEAAFEVEGSAIPFPVQDRSILIGRRQECDVALIESSVSAAHALLFALDGQWYLRDLSSRTGTWLNGARIHQQAVRFGDDIRIGETSMRFVPSTADALRPNVDELEDLVGTAPLLEPDTEEIPEQLLLPPADSIAAQRAAQQQRAPQATEAPAAELPPFAPTPEPVSQDDADAPLPLDFEFDDPILAGTEPAIDTEVEANALAADPVAESSPQPQEDANDTALADEPLKFALDDEPARAPMPLPGSGVMAPMGVIQAEGRDMASERGKGDDKGDLVQIEPEIDLASDPDVSGPADTTALRLAPDDTPRQPAISDRVVDAPDNADTVGDNQRRLVDVDAATDALKASTAGAPDAAEDTVAALNLDVADDDEAPAGGDREDEDAAVTPEPIEDVPLETRSGWRSRREPAPADPAPAAKTHVTEPPVPQPNPQAPTALPPATFRAQPLPPIPQPAVQPTEKFEGLDLSELDETLAAAADAEPIAFAGGILSEAATEPEPDLNLGLVHEDPDRIAPVEPPPVQPLIAPDAFETPQAAPTEKPRRARRAPAPAKPAAPKAAPAPKAPVEPKPAKPAARKAAAPAKPPAPAAKPAAPAKPTARKGRAAAKSAAATAASVPTEAEPIVAAFAPAEPVEAAEVTPPPAATGPVAEVIDTTEPTPESALDLGDLGEIPADIDPAPLVDVGGATASSLTDTGFGRQLNEFAGSAAEPVMVEPSSDDGEPSDAAVSSTFDSDLAAGDVSVASSDLTFDLDEPSEAGGQTGLTEPAEPDGLRIDPTAFSAEVSPANDVVEPEAERPRNALEQIAASFTAAPLDEVDDEDVPSQAQPPMGVLQADAVGAGVDAADAPPQPIDLPEAEAELNDVIEASPDGVVELPDDFAVAIDDDSIATEAAPLANDEVLEATADDDASSDALVATEPPLSGAATNEAGPESAVVTPVPLDAPPVARVPVGPDPDAWRMPDESDLLLPPDDDGHGGLSEGRDEASFIGGMPLPLSRQPTGEPAVDHPVARDDVQADSKPIAFDDLATSEAEPGSPADGESLVTATDDEPEADDAAVAEADASPPVSPDLVAAAVVAATTAPLPPRPRMGRRPTPFGKTPFEEIPDAPEYEGDQVPPFTGAGPATFGRVTTAFDGLAMPPVREADVFSHQVPGHVRGENRKARPATPGGAAVNETGDSTLGLTPETLEYAPARAARPATPGFRPPPAAAPGEGHRTPQPRRRKWFGLKWLLPLMVVTMLLSAGLIYTNVPVKTPVRGAVAYNNLDKVSQRVRDAMRTAQTRLAKDEAVRKQAADILSTKVKGMHPGFLAMTTEGATEVHTKLSIDFPPPGTSMVLQLTSTDPGRDAVRMTALLEAIQGANQKLKDDAERLREAERAATAELEAIRPKLLDRQVRLAQARQAGDNRPPGEDMDAAETELKKLEVANTAAVLKLNGVKAKLAQLQVETPGGTPDTAALAAVEREQAEAQQAVDAASKAYVEADLKVRGMQAARIEAQRAYETQVELEKEIASLKSDLERQQENVTVAAAARNSAVTVVPFDAAKAVSVPTPNDPRLLYVVLSTLAILVLFAALFAIAWKANADQGAADELSRRDEDAMPGDVPDPSDAMRVLPSHTDKVPAGV